MSERTVAEVFDRLAGAEGLTATASTFARQDVVVALGGELAGATRAELEALTDRFLAERAVAVVAERALEERRWSTPDLLSVEQRLVAAATGRAGEQTAVVSPTPVRAALAAHPTAGEDQAGMVRDLCQGGDGVALVEGRAGTGKTFALGSRPSRLAAGRLPAAGLRAHRDRHHEPGGRGVRGDGHRRPAAGRPGPTAASGSDERAVLVVDEAGMVGSRKLVRLLDHAEQAAGEGGAGRR